uniref:Uncharacterized protein n=1 Tax=Rhizophagus irregularis (strain DAOM 181602 / DAOM 197198 / MUCL 43194) TaxID=747089 RepID=U9U2V5_RHIID
MDNNNEFILSLTITKFKINLKRFNYVKFDNRFKSISDIITINSNFIHKAFANYEQYLSKPKGKRCKFSDF